MKQALLLLTAGLILIGGVFVFADRAGLTEDYSRVAVSFMRTDAEEPPVIIPANPDGTCDPGFHWKGDGFCESDPGLFDEEEEDKDEEVDSSGGGIDWFFPEGGFVPCGKRGDGDHPTTAVQEPCNICHAAELGQNILNFLVTTVMPFLAILFSAIGGFLIMTAGGNENRYRDGRDQLVRVAVGILIVLIAWAGINFVMSTFFDEEVTGSWYEFQCNVPQEPDVPDFVPGEWVFAPSNAEPGSSTLLPGTGLSQDVALKQLTDAGVSVAGGTKLEGIKDGVVKEIILLKTECKCAITVTSATGGNHSPGSLHYDGYKIDIDDTAAVSNYILSTFRECGSRSGAYAGEKWCHPSRGTVYVLEYRRANQNCSGTPVGVRAPFPSCGQHWDIEVR